MKQARTPIACKRTRSAGKRLSPAIASAFTAAVALLAVACGSDVTPTGASGPAGAVTAASPAVGGSSSVQASGREKIDICHRTRWAYIPISVSEAALDAHLAHGDARVGDAVPGQEGMIFDATCTAVASGGTILIGGFFDGRTSFPSGGFTLVAAGLVSAFVTVTSGYALPTPMHLELLGFNPTVTAREQCSAQWLAAPVPPGPSMPGPALVGHWVVPPGSYCVVVAGQNLPPLNWSGSVTY